jgi:hypothetical protein
MFLNASTAAASHSSSELILKCQGRRDSLRKVVASFLVGGKPFGVSRGPLRRLAE